MPYSCFEHQAPLLPTEIELPKLETALLPLSVDAPQPQFQPAMRQAEPR